MPFYPTLQRGRQPKLHQVIREEQESSEPVERQRVDQTTNENENKKKATSKQTLTSPRDHKLPKEAEANGKNATARGQRPKQEERQSSTVARKALGETQTSSDNGQKTLGRAASLQLKIAQCFNSFKPKRETPQAPKIDRRTASIETIAPSQIKKGVALRASISKVRDGRLDALFDNDDESKMEQMVRGGMRRTVATSSSTIKTLHLDVHRNVFTEPIGRKFGIANRFEHTCLCECRCHSYSNRFSSSDEQLLWRMLTGGNSSVFDSLNTSTPVVRRRKQRPSTTCDELLIAHRSIIEVVCHTKYVVKGGRK
ncbi:unnamed protein product [Soboliphyme baturini]|uniref:Uncharacterized protein n=1 Tax=Soboliphyme baturini TaxID=241478 RepID=A0A183IB62_9BILA|nr:unnamed protein product [Soboliphyme baturini]